VGSATEGVARRGEDADVAFDPPVGEEPAGVEGEVLAVPAPDGAEAVRREGGGVEFVPEAAIDPRLERLEFGPAEDAVTVGVGPAIDGGEDGVVDTSPGDEGDGGSGRTGSRRTRAGAVTSSSTAAITGGTPTKATYRYGTSMA
jgi:hypothetical protein